MAYTRKRPTHEIDEEQPELYKKKRDDDDLARSFMAMTVGREDYKECCSTCTKRMSRSMCDDWNYWVCMAQDEAGLTMVQTYLCVWVKRGYGSDYTSSRGTGIYVLMCDECLQYYKEIFDKVAKAKTRDAMPEGFTRMQELSDKHFEALQTIARLLCHQIVAKKQAIEDEL